MHWGVGFLGVGGPMGGLVGKMGGCTWGGGVGGGGGGGEFTNSGSKIVF